MGLTQRQKDMLERVKDCEYQATHTGVPRPSVLACRVAARMGQFLSLQYPDDFSVEPVKMGNKEKGGIIFKRDARNGEGYDYVTCTPQGGVRVDFKAAPGMERHAQYSTSGNLPDAFIYQVLEDLYDLDYAGKRLPTQKRKYETPGRVVIHEERSM